MRELREIPALRTALEDARDYTLQLYAHLTPEQRRFPRMRSVNPPAWELAHVGWFQEFWCLRFRDRDEPLPARLPDADALLNSSITPHAERWDLPELTWELVLNYLARGFQRYPRGARTDRAGPALLLPARSAPRGHAR